MDKKSMASRNTPTKKTIGFFNHNMVSEYTHEDAVVDKVNVGYDIYRITNSSGTNLVALKCATKRGAPWTARNRAFRLSGETINIPFDRMSCYV